MAALEDLYYTQERHDFQAVVKTYEQFSQAVLDMVDMLLKMCPSRYWSLKDYYKKFDFYVRFMLAPPEANCSPPFTIDLNKASLLDEYIAGKKTFALSELNQKLHLPTPDGFVITTHAFHYFLEANALKTPINEKLALLDINDPSSLKKTAQELKTLILSANVPEDIEKDITASMAFLLQDKKPDFRVALRSSAVKEDGATSFAGLYDTLLNVSKQDISDGYKRVIASKYNSRALYYRVNHGILDEETPMAVLVLEMIDSNASGVVYTQDLEIPESSDLFIHSIPGQGEQLVDGKVSPDIIRVSKNNLNSIAGMTVHKEGRLSLDETSALTLARWGALLEAHFKAPQDIEWAQDPSGRLFLLQSRPLHIPSQEIQSRDHRPTIKNKPLCLAHETVCSGVGAGPVYRLKQISQADQIPQGSVVVTKQASPQLVTAIHHMAAIVIETGSRASHFSSIVREFNVPAIVNTVEGFHDLIPGSLVTVDADHCRVYKGIATPLLERAVPDTDAFKKSAFMTKLQYVINFTAQLKLTDPTADAFVPEGCRSLHDIIRFTHETAMQEMFLSGNRKGSRKKGAKKLISGLPLLFYILDVGGGVKKETGDRANEKFLRPENLASIPMIAILNGLSHPGISWAETSHFDWEAYDRIVMAGGIISPDSPQFGSYAVVSKEYVNINFRFGYHFVILDTICSHHDTDNYILFRFSGGGGTPEGRRLRAGFIEGILIRLGFTVQVKSDLIDAEFKQASLATMEKTLDMVGRLLGATKLMDMYLKENMEYVSLVDDFMNGRYDFRSSVATQE